jgi:hypothetical protein
MRPVQRLATLAAIAVSFGAPLHAQVIRCADANGAVSYTDKSCPPGSALVGRIEIPDPPPPPPNAVPSVLPSSADSRAAAVQAPPSMPVPAPVVPQGYAGGYPQGQGVAPGDATVADDGSAYPYPYPYAGGYAPGAPLPDMRPQMRKCDASGCLDTLGNHYNRAGQVDRYQAANGKTCRPIGTTTFCR